jgi:hypothetical protein
VDAAAWIVDEYADARQRLTNQVLGLVPPERRAETPGGGNSVLWGCFHVARHTDFALSVLTGSEPLLRAPSTAGYEGAGLEEAEQPWAVELDPAGVDAGLARVADAAAAYLAALSGGGPDDDTLASTPDAASALERAAVPADRFDWLYRMWSGQPAAWFVRWPIVGHLANHTGEMIATRNRMGLSPF